MNIEIKQDLGEIREPTGMKKWVDWIGRRFGMGGATPYVTNPAGQPIQVCHYPGQPVETTTGTADAMAPEGVNHVAIPASSTVYRLPKPGALYCFLAVGNSAYVKDGLGGIPTATTTVSTGYDICCPEGALIGPFKMSGPMYAIIGNSAAGVLQIFRKIGS